MGKLVKIVSSQQRFAFTFVPLKHQLVLNKSLLLMLIQRGR